MTDAWLTPDGDESGVVCRKVVIPAGYVPFVNGALFELTDSENWEKFGTDDIEDAAEKMAVMLDGYFGSICDMEIVSNVQQIQIDPGTTEKHQFTPPNGAMIERAGLITSGTDALIMRANVIVDGVEYTGKFNNSGQHHWNDFSLVFDGAMILEIEVQASGSLSNPVDALVWIGGFLA